MKNLAVVCFALCLFATGVSSLKCNLCIGGENSDCAQGKPTAMATQTCGVPIPSVKGGPPPADAAEQARKIEEYCVELKIKGDDVTSTVVEYGCGYIYEGVDICDYIKQNSAKDKIEVCKYCKGDLCN